MCPTIQQTMALRIICLVDTQDVVHNFTSLVFPTGVGAINNRWLSFPLYTVAGNPLIRRATS